MIVYALNRTKIADTKKGNGMYSDNSVGIVIGFALLFVWLLLWSSVGWSAGLRHNRGGLGAFMGLLFGPLVLFIFFIPNAAELKAQSKNGKTK